MKVGVLLRGYSPELGGGHTFEADVFDSLSRLSSTSQHEFCVLANEDCDSSAIQSEHLPIVPLRNPPRPRRSKLARIAKRATKKGRRELRRSRLELAGNWQESSILQSGVDFVWYPTPAVVTMEVPYIVTVWDLQHRLQPFFPEVSAGTEWEMREIQFRASLRRAAFVVTGTETGLAEIESFYQVPANRIRKLPHPTPRFALAHKPRDDQQELQKFGLTDGYLFYPAQLWSHKNHAGLLRAVNLLKERHGLVLPVVFSGADKGNRAYLEQLTAELGLTDQVHFLGFVSREELAALYRNAFALTYVTYFGPENLPPLEAFALGCPVIASSVSGAEEQLGDAALLVPPDRPDEIATAIFDLHRNRELRDTLIQRGRRRATRFTADDFVRGIFDILDEFEPIRNCWGKGAA